jgi:ATP-dependent Clp protease ATP-binding subunit ClpB
VDFKNTVLILTSNIGSPHLLEGVGPDGEISDMARTAVMGELRRHFRPEFLNRVDDIVMFKPLTLPEIQKIVGLLTIDLAKRLADRKIGLELTGEATALVAQEGFDPVYGARPLKRFLQHELETKIARALLGGQVSEGSTVVVDARDGRLVVDLVPEAVPVAS